MKIKRPPGRFSFACVFYDLWFYWWVLFPAFSHLSFHPHQEITMHYYYPYDGEEVINAVSSESCRKWANAFLIFAIGACVTLFISVYIGLLQERHHEKVIWFAVLCFIAYAILSEKTIPKHISNHLLGRYTQKARYEEMLMHLMERICENRHINNNLRQAMLIDSLIEIYYAPGYATHLEHIKREARSGLTIVVDLEIEHCSAQINELFKGGAPDNMSPAEVLIERIKALRQIRAVLNKGGGITIDA